MSDPSDEDLAARKYAAAHDPAFPARREEAFSAIIAALDTTLQPLGYALKGTTFTRVSQHGRSAVHLQRSRYGWDAQIVLRFLTAGGDPVEHPDWPDDEDLTLLHFSGDVTRDPGRLAFVDVLEDPAHLALALEILMTRALPWLDGLHQSDV